MIYRQHWIFCTQQKSDPSKPCCSKGGSYDLYQYTINIIKELNLHSIDQIRVTTSSCLGLCRLGPNLVIYPEGAWYNPKNNEDIDRIIKKYVHREETNLSDLRIDTIE